MSALSFGEPCYAAAIFLSITVISLHSEIGQYVTDMSLILKSDAVVEIPTGKYGK